MADGDVPVGIQRYGTDALHNPVPHPSGVFVLYTDYTALEAQLAEITRERDMQAKLYRQALARAKRAEAIIEREL